MKNIEDLLRQSKEGDLDASVKLGWCYYIGDCVEKNDEKAHEYFTKVAEKNDSRGYFYLGIMCADESTVYNDAQKAFEYMEKSAKMGNTMAQLELCYYYEDGYGVDVNKQEALNWLMKSANGNNAGAQNTLGTYYCSGKYSVGQDFGQALFWLTKAAEQCDDEAEKNLGLMYLNGDGVKQNDSESFAWYLKAARHNNVDAQYIVGNMYYDGIGVEQSYEKSYEWHSIAAKNGHANSYTEIGLLYLRGHGVEKNDRTATEYFEKAMDMGAPYGTYNYAESLRHGRGIEKNIYLSIQYFEKAAEQGVPEAASSLSIIYWDINPAKSFEWLKKAASRDDESLNLLIQRMKLDDRRYAHEVMGKELGLINSVNPRKYEVDELLYWLNVGVSRDLPNAICCMGKRYIEGEIIEKNIGKGVEMLKYAAERGEACAQLDIGKYYKTGFTPFVERSIEKAITYLEGAAKGEYASAQYELSEIYLKDSYSNYNNIERGLYWLHKAVEEGEAEALLDLALLYREGQYVTKDLNRALGLAKEATDKGNTVAASLYQNIYDEMYSTPQQPQKSILKKGFFGKLFQGNSSSNNNIPLAPWKNQRYQDIDNLMRSCFDRNSYKFNWELYFSRRDEFIWGKRNFMNIYSKNCIT